jgi:hypothetical protein
VVHRLFKYEDTKAFDCFSFTKQSEIFFGNEAYDKTGFCELVGSFPGSVSKSSFPSTTPLPQTFTVKSSDRVREQHNSKMLLNLFVKNEEILRFLLCLL